MQVHLDRANRLRHTPEHYSLASSAHTCAMQERMPMQPWSFWPAGDRAVLQCRGQNRNSWQQYPASFLLPVSLPKSGYTSQEEMRTQGEERSGAQGGAIISLTLLLPHKLPGFKFSLASPGISSHARAKQRGRSMGLFFFLP